MKTLSSILLIILVLAINCQAKDKKPKAEAPKGFEIPDTKWEKLSFNMNTPQIKYLHDASVQAFYDDIRTSPLIVEVSHVAIYGQFGKDKTNYRVLLGNRSKGGSFFELSAYDFLFDKDSTNKPAVQRVSFYKILKNFKANDIEFTDLHKIISKSYLANNHITRISRILQYAEPIPGLTVYFSQFGFEDVKYSNKYCYVLKENGKYTDVVEFKRVFEYEEKRL